MVQTVKITIWYSSWFFNLPSAVKTDKSFNPQKAQHNFYKRKLDRHGRNTLAYFIYAFIKKCVCIYMLKLNKHINIYTHMILYGIFTNTQKATTLQTSKNTLYDKCKTIEGFPATAVTTEVSELIHDLTKKKKKNTQMQQNQYDPLALSHQAAVVAAASFSSHTLLEHTRDASRNIFSMYRQKTSNQFSVPSSWSKLHPPSTTFSKGAWRAHEMAQFGDP